MGTADLKQLRSKAVSVSPPRHLVKRKFAAAQGMAGSTEVDHADSVLQAPRAGRVKHGPANPGEALPTFYDVWQSWGATWDVWSSTQLGTQHIQLAADQRLRALLLWARENSD